MSFVNEEELKNKNKLVKDYINPIKTKRGRLSPSGSFFLHISEINRTNNLKFLDFVPNLVIIHLPKFESVITCILKVISN